MQSFRNYLYYNEEKTTSITNQIEEFNSTKTTSEYSRTTNVGGQAKIIVADAEVSTSETKFDGYTINTTILEKFVNWSLNEKNAINYSGQTLKNEEKDKIIIIKGKMYTPEMSDNIEAINTLKSNKELMEYVAMSEEDKKMINYIKEGDKIPILLECDSEYIFNFIVKKEYIKGDIGEIYDNLEEDITVIGKIENIYNTKESIEIYDMAKEVFKISRSIRRQLDTKDLKDLIITEKGPLVKILPLVIYK